MKTQQFTQTSPIGGAGSFHNQLMGNNNTFPVVGKGATQLHYTDRTCFEVIEVTDGGKTAKLQYLEAIHNTDLPGGPGHQNWLFIPTNHFLTIKWRYNQWCVVGKEIIFDEKFIQECNANKIGCIGVWLRENNPELADKIYDGYIMPSKVIEGYTKQKTTYNKINIIFGTKDYYYDWSF